MIERVSGLDDPRVAGYRHVGDARWLREHGLFVAEGRLVVRRLIEEPHISIGSILLTPAGRRRTGWTCSSARRMS